MVSLFDQKTWQYISVVGFAVIWILSWVMCTLVDNYSKCTNRDDTEGMKFAVAVFFLLSVILLCLSIVNLDEVRTRIEKAKQVLGGFGKLRKR
jgi:drug/metabolite transporter (DMT)-like permease